MAANTGNAGTANRNMKGVGIKHQRTCSTTAAASARAAARSASSLRAACCMTHAADARRWKCGRQLCCTTAAARLQYKRKLYDSKFQTTIKGPSCSFRSAAVLPAR